LGLGTKQSQAQPTEGPNTLRSTSFAKILLLLCKGRIKRWVGANLGNALQIDGVPLQSPDNSLNFRGWDTFFREGIPNQPHIPGLEQNSVIISVGETVRADIDVVRTINEPDTDAIKVVIKIPALLSTTDSGDIVGASVSYVIEYQPSGQSYQTAVSQTITDKTSSPYQRSHHIVLEGDAPWNIRVHRSIADSRDESKLKNAFEWDYLTRIEYDKRGYSGYAVVGLHINVKELSSLSAVDVIIDAQLVLCPHNYNGESHSYSGIFDGSLLLQWSNNPVWILLDVLLERVPLSAIRIYEFYDAARYCDETINGKPRFTFNHVFDQRQSAYATAREIAGSFNARLVPRGTKIGLTVDKPMAPVRNFDVDEMSERPSYRVTSSLEVATTATVTYLEPAQNYEPVSFVVRDGVGIDRFGDREINLKAIGCTDRNQAARSALWALATPRLNPVKVKFQIPLSGKLVIPGETFTITDPRRDGLKMSGRIYSYTPDAQGDRISIDSAYTFVSGKIYDFCLFADNGTALNYEISAERTGLGKIDEIRLLPNKGIAVSDRPRPGDIWLIKPRGTASGIAYRALSVLPVSGKHSHYEIEGVLYDANKYRYIDTLGAEYAVDYRANKKLSVLNLPGIPFGLNAIEHFKVSTSGSIISAATLSWAYPEEDTPQLDYFQVEYRKEDRVAWQPAGITTGRSYVFDNIDPDDYEFRVAAVSRIGKRSEWGSTEITRAGTYDPSAPLSASNLTLSKSESNTVHLKWDASEESNVRFGGFFRIRHTPRIVDAFWESGTLVARSPGYTDEVTLPYQDGTYMLRTYNSQGIPSSLPSKVSTTLLPGLGGQTVLYTFLESPLFSGAKSGVEVVTSKLRLTSEATGGAFVKEGYYTFQRTFEVNGNESERFYLYPVVDVSVIRQEELWDNLANPFDNNPVEVFFETASDPETDYGESPFAKIEISLSQNGGVSYSEWQELVPGIFFATNIAARLHMATDSPGLSNEISTLQLIVLSA
jgi:predicted phage tail protein